MRIDVTQPRAYCTMITLHAILLGALFKVILQYSVKGVYFSLQCNWWERT